MMIYSMSIFKSHQQKEESVKPNIIVLNLVTSKSVIHFDFFRFLATLIPTTTAGKVNEDTFFITLCS